MSEGHPHPVATAGWTSQTYFKNFRTLKIPFYKSAIGSRMELH